MRQYISLIIILLFLVGCSSSNNDLQPINNSGNTNNNGNINVLDQNLFGHWKRESFDYHYYLSFMIIDSVGVWQSERVYVPTIDEQYTGGGNWWVENNKLHRENNSTGEIQVDSYSININEIGEVFSITINNQNWEIWF